GTMPALTKRRVGSSWISGAEGITVCPFASKKASQRRRISAVSIGLSCPISGAGVSGRTEDPPYPPVEDADPRESSPPAAQPPPQPGPPVLQPGLEAAVGGPVVRALGQLGVQVVGQVLLLRHGVGLVVGVDVALDPRAADRSLRPVRGLG